MAINDARAVPEQIIGAKHQPIASHTHQVQREVPSDDEDGEGRYAFAMNEFQQSILQGEQESDSPTNSQHRQPIRQNSVISSNSIIEMN